MRKLVIIGASGHGKVVADIAEKNGYEKIIFLDDNSDLKECAGFPVVGNINEIEAYKSYYFFVAIGDAIIRKHMQELLNEEKLVTLIHPSTTVADDVVIGRGTVIMAGTVISPGAKIGKGCILNTCSSVDHDCVVEDYVHIAVGSHLCGTVTVGDGTWIGAGATVSNNVSICPQCMIGAGAVVINDIKESGTYIGVPARRIDICRKV